MFLHTVTPIFIVGISFSIYFYQFIGFNKYVIALCSLLLWVCKPKNFFFCRCFPKNVALFVGVVIVASLLQVFIWTAFLIIAFTLWRRSYKAINRQYPTTTKPKEMRKNTAVLVTLSVLFGLPWIIVFAGFLLRNHPSVGNPMLFVAGVIDLFQGPMLFLVQGIRLSEIQQLWRRWLCCECCKVGASLKTSSNPISASQNSLNGMI